MEQHPRVSFGEYVRRLRRQKRWQLQDLADATGLSVTHLSRIENDNAVPNAESVVKLANALDGDLTFLLQLAECLPREILDRLSRRADDHSHALRRAAGEGADLTFARTLVEDIDPPLRRSLATWMGIAEEDTDAIFRLLHELAVMPEAQRQALITFVNMNTREVVE